MNNEQKILDFINAWKPILKKSELESVVDTLQAAIDNAEISNLKDKQEIRTNTINKALSAPTIPKQPNTAEIDK
jgi:hypothetical protein